MDKEVALEITKQLRGTRKQLVDVLGELYGKALTPEIIQEYKEGLNDMIFLCDECKRWRPISQQSTTGLVRSCDRCFDSGILN